MYILHNSSQSELSAYLPGRYTRQGRTFNISILFICHPYHLDIRPTRFKISLIC
jgi:hypothetical protein